MKSITIKFAVESQDEHIKHQTNEKEMEEKMEEEEEKEEKEREEGKERKKRKKRRKKEERGSLVWSQNWKERKGGAMYNRASKLPV
jgi:hypothetical protein